MKNDTDILRVQIDGEITAEFKDTMGGLRVLSECISEVWLMDENITEITIIRVKAEDEKDHS